MEQEKAREANLKAHLEELSWEHEVLMQRCAQEERDRDDLRAKFEEEAFSIQQTALLHAMLMEKKMGKIDEMVEKRVCMAPSPHSHLCYIILFIPFSSISP